MFLDSLFTDYWLRDENTYFSAPSLQNATCSSRLPPSLLQTFRLSSAFASGNLLRPTCQGFGLPVPSRTSCGNPLLDVLLAPLAPEEQSPAWKRNLMDRGAVLSQLSVVPGGLAKPETRTVFCCWRRGLARMLPERCPLWEGPLLLERSSSRLPPKSSSPHPPPRLLKQNLVHPQDFGCPPLSPNGTVFASFYAVAALSSHPAPVRGCLWSSDMVPESTWLRV